MAKKKLIKENDNCPSCNIGMMVKIGNQLVCTNCALKANQINDSEIYEFKEIDKYYLW